MKRSEQNEKIEVVCPECGKTRMISKKAYVKSGGDLGDKIYTSIDRGCAQKKKKLADEHKKKISRALDGRKQSKAHIESKRRYMKNHPEAWQSNIVTKGDSLSEEHKRKISEAKKGGK